ncbi:MAG: KH domain-containing protein [Candidatus Aenigmarchaeota archaeon]|nr:KH domain-containing protein [Candidatus Aenigmarchaeota archaeon]MBU5689348.1 KH domain-containing protein [Candidatus Aenigmarchaeota archaeon]
MKDFIKIPLKYKKVLLKKPNIKEEIERVTNTKITINEDIEIDGDGLNVYVAKNIIKAFGRGFSIEDALKLVDDLYSLEIIDLSDYANTDNRIKVISGRIIGSQGKTKKYIERYTNTKIAVSGKTVSIIGKWDDINLAREAILMLIRGSTHKTVYRWLEQNAKVNEW